MNTPQESPREGAAGGDSRILVWDWPVRLFHWTLAGSFAGAWLTAESERLALWHMSFGFTVAGLILFRLAWGVAGTRYARFRAFITGPAQVWRYLRSLTSARPERHIGHNPAGAVAIVLLLLLGLGTAASGALHWQEIGGERFEEVHEALATLMLVVVGVHVAGVVVSSLLHRENLVGAMFSGRKRGPAAAGIPGGRPLVALVLAGGLLAFWSYAWSPASLLRGGAADAEAVAIEAPSGAALPRGASGGDRADARDEAARPAAAVVAGARRHDEEEGDD